MNNDFTQYDWALQRDAFEQWEEQEEELIEQIDNNL